MRSNRVLKLAIACTLASVAGTAVAQEKSGEPNFEVIVTAQKREQNLQDVPVVVTAVSEQLLHDGGVKDIKDLTLLTPGLLVTSSSSEASTTARIRGVGTVGDNPGLESSVGVVIDGVYRPRNGVSFGDLGEMERVEVLKGPQGTLFGKNTSAGVINVVTKKPTFTPNSYAEMTFGNLNAFELATSANGPVVGDTVAGRIFVAVRQRDGIIDVRTPATGNTRPENDDGNRDFYTLRGQLLFNLADNLTLRVVGDYTARDEYCCSAVQVVYGQPQTVLNTIAGGPGLAVAATARLEDRVAYANRPNYQDTDEKGVSAEFNADLGDSELTSITAWRDWTSTRGQDADYTTVDIWYRNADGNVFSRFQQLTQEFRLAGQTGPVNWLGGIFYAHEKLNTSDQLLYGRDWEAYLSRTVTGNATAAGLSAWTGLAPGNVYRAGTGLKDSYQQVAESFALFTNNSIEITEGLELTIGARLTSESKELKSYHWNPGATGSTACSLLQQNIRFVNTGQGSLPAGASAIPASAALQGGVLSLGCGTWADPAFNNLNLVQSLDESKFTGTGKLAYRFTDEIMSYVSYARGYKASGFNLDRERSAIGVADADKSFPEEIVDSYEVGIKNSLLDGALLVNASYFDQKFENFQLNTFLGTSFIVTAVKEVSSRGVDFDAIYQTRMGLGVQGGVTYAKTEIEEFGAAAGIVQHDRRNDRLGFAPKWSGSLAVTYRTNIGDYALNSNVSAKSNSSYNTGSNLDRRKIQEAYTLVNARIGVGPQDAKWTIELWSQNLGDEDYAQVMFDAPLQGSSAAYPATSTIDAFLGAPRTYGATLTARF